MKLNLEELKEKYEQKVISNTDIMEQECSYTIIYDSRYFVLNLLDELFQELEKIDNETN